MNVVKVADAAFPTEFGNFRILGFESDDKSENAIALVMGDPSKDPASLLRIHSQCLTGDVFASSRCDCGEQLRFAQKTIAGFGSGILIYQLQEGRGIGLMNKLMAYQLQDTGQYDTITANEELGFEADHRDYALCAAILKYLGVGSVRLMSNNPRKSEALTESGIAIAERIPVEIAPTDQTRNYLATKKAKLGHTLSTV